VHGLAALRSRQLVEIRDTSWRDFRSGTRNAWFT